MKQLSIKLDMKYRIESALFPLKMWFKRNKSDLKEALFQAPLFGCVVWVLWTVNTGGLT
jgi:hypothetical protein